MSTTAKPVVSARVERHHAELLQRMAERNASTLSRIVGRILAERSTPTPPPGCPRVRFLRLRRALQLAIRVTLDLASLHD